MTPATSLRLDRLFLRNFRCFAECTLELHEHLTVLVAENGRGKTAVLDAIGIALGLFVDTGSPAASLQNFTLTNCAQCDPPFESTRSNQTESLR